MMTNLSADREINKKRTNYDNHLSKLQLLVALHKNFMTTEFKHSQEA